MLPLFQSPNRANTFLQRETFHRFKKRLFANFQNIVRQNKSINERFEYDPCKKDRNSSLDYAKRGNERKRRCLFFIQLYF